MCTAYLCQRSSSSLEVCDSLQRTGSSRQETSKCALLVHAPPLHFLIYLVGFNLFIVKRTTSIHFTLIRTSRTDYHHEHVETEAPGYNNNNKDLDRTATLLFYDCFDLRKAQVEAIRLSWHASQSCVAAGEVVLRSSDWREP